MNDVAAPMGHNNPPVSQLLTPADFLNPDFIREMLGTSHEAVLSRTQGMIDGAVRMFATHAGVAIVDRAPPIEGVERGQAVVIRTTEGWCLLVAGDDAWVPSRIMTAVAMAEALATRGAAIRTPEEANRVTEMVALMKAAKKAQDDARKAAKAPYDAAAKATQNFFAAGIDALDVLATTTQRRLLTPYVQALEAERQAAEEAQRRVQAEADAQAAEARRAVLAAQMAVEPPPPEPAPPPAPAKAARPARIAGSTVGATRSVTRFRITVVDSALIPREYLAFDEAKVRAQLRVGSPIPEIPGLEITSYQETIVA